LKRPGIDFHGEEIQNEFCRQKNQEGCSMPVNAAAQTSGASFIRGTIQGAPSIGYVPKVVHYAFLLFVFSIPFEDLKLPYVTSGTFSLAKLCGLIFFFIYAIYLLLQVLFFKKSIPKVPFAMRWFVAYFVIYALGTWLLDHEPGRVYFLRLVALIQIVGFFWCASDLLKDQNLSKSSLLVFALACNILAIGALLNLPGFVPEVDERTRALGMNPNAGAGLMVGGALILMAFCLNETHWSRWRKGLLFILTLPLLAFLVSTASRAGVGGFIIGVSMFFLARGGLKRKIIASLLALVAAAAVLILVATNNTAAERWAKFFERGDSARLNLYGTILEMFNERPIVGWGRTTGFEELGYRMGLGGRIDTHNFLLYLMLEGGLLGTVPFLTGLALCLWAAWKARAGPLGILPLTLVISSLAMMMTHTGLTAKQFWLFLALTLASAGTVKRKILFKVTTAPHMGLLTAERKAVVRDNAIRARRH
jgi:O-antigen ligase